MKIEHFFESIYLPKKLHSKEGNTARLYRLSIRSFGKTLGRPATLDDLTDDQILSHMQRVVGAGRSPATANKDREQLCVLWRHACKLGLLNRWPSVAKMREIQRVPTAWMASDIEKLRATASEQQGDFGGVPRALWWQSLLSVCFDTAERIGAVSQARWEWLSNGWLLMPAEVRKGGKRDKQFMLQESTLELLNRIKATKADTQLIFPWPYCHAYLWKLYGELVEKAGLPNGRRDKFHKLRRTTASIAHSIGMNAQELLDHQHRRTTDRYLDPRFTREEQASAALAKYLANPSICHRQMQQDSFRTAN